jgi:hypothetical protein
MNTFGGANLKNGGAKHTQATPQIALMDIFKQNPNLLDATILCLFKNVIS